MMFHTQIVCVARSLVRAARACLLLLLLAMPVASFAASPALSLEEATRLAVERAPMLNARRSQIEAAEQESRRAGALPDPMLTVGIDNLPVTGPDAFDVQADFMTMKRIGLRQEVPARAERNAERSLAARNIDKAQADAQAEQLEVRRETAEAWIDLWATQRELDELMALREATELARRLARARGARSEASRVGKECVSQCGSRGWPDN